MAAQYHSLFTEAGLELLRESIQNGTKLGITHMSFGDGYGELPVPDASFTGMVNEVYRVALNRLAPSRENSNWLEADGVIPSAVGGFNIREVGLWADNVMVAYANYPPTYKPSGDQGTAQIKTIRIVLQIDNTANFELKIDSSVVMATVAFVEEKTSKLESDVMEYKASLESIQKNVYANMYGDSLNEAMTSINEIFKDQRVRIIVPSDFPVTDTVNLAVNCDLDMKSLQVMNDIEVIFDPAVNWSGTSSSVDVFCNNKSVKCGWNLKKDLGYISIEKTTFFDVGNQSENTSAEYFVGFHIQHKNIKKLDLFSPSVINSFVKPNGIVGDSPGFNRLIIIEGYFGNSDTSADINIHNPYARGIYPEEDADGIAINFGSGSISNFRVNIDIHNGYFENVHRRAVKVIGHEKNVTGLRFHGDMTAIAGGLNPWSAIDISGICQVDWNGTVYCIGWVQDLNVWGGAYLIGEMNLVSSKSERQIVNGNSQRCLVCDDGLTTNPIRKCLVDINSIIATNSYESMRVRGGQTVKLKKLKHNAIARSLNIENSNLEIEKFELYFNDSSEVVSYSNNCNSILSSKVNIKEIYSEFNQTSSIQYMFSIRQTEGFEVEKVTQKGNISSTLFLLTTCNNTKIRKAKGETNYIVSAITGGNNLLLEQCVPASLGLIANNSQDPLLNVVELNTQAF
ncbi:MAG: phage tail protein [Acinetobacter amyesii]|uniref:phage tail protein n=1 Tax=Acinetobacter amyesii TaxID=2942470 RepID=UPI003D04D30F